ncbi:S-layer homology domain-containing protein [Lysinibacillus tabacifolii]|uniref:S-layer homology domain-containing protein n=1 Tax=Lysinibacillus tabacifolii TaxID=1173107 RepID=A0ABY2T3F6_9BACI|nr:S-layer homology domain-containing protein [Lysinibacillus tabacifolii]TKI50579.1 S-layer homology domain-containing protein [Lysinibacillus tabacifolii]
MNKGRLIITVISIVFIALFVIIEPVKAVYNYTFTVTPKVSSTTQVDASFSDVYSKNTHSTAILTLASQGVIELTDGTFKPTQAITREQAVAWLNRTFKLEKIRSYSGFKDVDKSNKYYEDIVSAYEAGVIDGSQGNFSGGNSISRGQMAKILIEALGLDVTKVGKSPFRDTTDQWFENYATVLYELEITTGTTPTTFSPYDNVTRQQFASFLYRALQKFEMQQEQETPENEFYTDEAPTVVMTGVEAINVIKNKEYMKWLDSSADKVSLSRDEYRKNFSKQFTEYWDRSQLFRDFYANDILTSLLKRGYGPNYNPVFSTLYSSSVMLSDDTTSSTIIGDFLGYSMKISLSSFPKNSYDSFEISFDYLNDKSLEDALDVIHTMFPHLEIDNVLKDQVNIIRSNSDEILPIIQDWIDTGSKGDLYLWKSDLANSVTFLEDSRDKEIGIKPISIYDKYGIDPLPEGWFIRLGVRTTAFGIPLGRIEMEIPK